MRQYNFFHPFILSFFSKSLYRDVARNWKGTCFLYLFILLFICWIPVVYVINKQVEAIASKTLPSFVNQVPTVTIKHGQVSIDKLVPYFIQMPDNKKIFAVIDTSGKYNNLDDTDAEILLTKTKLYIRSQHDIKEYDLSRIENKVITKENIYSFIKIIKNWIFILLFPAVLGFSFAYRIIQSLCYALIGTFIFNNILHTNLGYKQILRLSVVALTPVIILSTVLDVFVIRLQYQWLLYFFITMLYLFFAIRVNGDQE